MFNAFTVRYDRRCKMFGWVGLCGYLDIFPCQFHKDPKPLTLNPKSTKLVLCPNIGSGVGCAC